MRIYATESDWDEWAETSEAERPPELLKKLRGSSVTIERLTASAVYRTDEDGYPVDPAISEALRDATILQVQWELDHAEEFAPAPKYTSVSLGPLSLGVSKNANPADRTPRDSPTAVALLKSNGLMNNRPWS